MKPQLELWIKSDNHFRKLIPKRRRTLTGDDVFLALVILTASLFVYLNI